MQTNDPLELTIELCKRQSITPKDEGCQDVIGSILKEHGFEIEFIEKDGTKNIYATKRRGVGPYLLFLGHTDVVPEGDINLWDSPPYACNIIEYYKDQYLVARGSADMKGADAAMTLALCRFVKEHKDFKGTLGLLLTSNEEGDAKGGVPYVASLLKERNDIPDMCIVGEPSSSHILGDTIKIGRRGSMTGHFTVNGIQGHVAYPDKVLNPIILASKLIEKLSLDLDLGTCEFPKTSFQVTNIKSGVGAENLVPASCYFMCNWRFNNLQSPKSIQDKALSYVKELGLNCDIKWVVNGLPFVCQKDNKLVSNVFDAVYKITGIKAKLSTAGGTSDGRFIAPLGTDVLEFGVCNDTIHKVNEKVLTDDLYKLTDIFTLCIEKCLMINKA